MSKNLLLALLVVAIPILGAVAADGTTFQMVYDGDLHQQADVIARVEVLATSAAPGFGAPHTDNIVLIERLLKGRVSGTTVVVRSLGGVGPDGLGLAVYGTPQFDPGDRVLLFLRPRHDGTYGILHLMLGAFFEVGPEERPMAIRKFEGAEPLESTGTDEPQSVRDWVRFQSWLADRSNGVVRDPDYLTERPSSMGTIFARNLLEFERKPIRFFEFDSGQKVTWKVGRGARKARKSFRKAIKVWNGDRKTEVLLEQKGRTRNTNGFVAPDGVNSIIFGDPNDEVDGSYHCLRGGVIALGGAWFYTSPALVRKIPKNRGKGKANVALEADIILNDGAECLVSGDVKAASQVFGHEIGHTLGLGHSCDDPDSGPCNTPSKSDALMRAFFHEDGRGAVLGSWDRQWLDKLY